MRQVYWLSGAASISCAVTGVRLTSVPDVTVPPERLLMISFVERLMLWPSRQLASAGGSDGEGVGDGSVSSGLPWLERANCREPRVLLKQPASIGRATAPKIAIFENFEDPDRIPYLSV